MQPSPYTPASVADIIAGRDTQLAHYAERLSYLADLHRLVPRIRVENGPRGMGKTSLLRHVQRRAESAGVATVWTTTNPGSDDTVLAAMLKGLDDAAKGWVSRSKERVAKLRRNMTLTVSAGLPGIATIEASNKDPQASGGGQDSRDELGIQQFKIALIAAAQAAEQSGRRGLVLFVDEIQDADARSLRTIAHCWQELQAEHPTLPVALFAAGLPDSPGVISAAVTHSERFDYRTLGPIEDHAARVALAQPAGQLGVRWDPQALAVAVAYSHGNPFVLQLFGEETWQSAGRPDPGQVITPRHADQAMHATDAALDGLFRARWDRATPAEQRLMRAVATLGDGPIARAAVVQYLGYSSSDVISAPRASLIDKGLLEAPVYGELQFTIPGFAAWIRRTTETLPVAPPIADPERARLQTEIARLQQQIAQLPPPGHDPSSTPALLAGLDPDTSQSIALHQQHRPEASTTTITPTTPTPAPAQHYLHLRGPGHSR